MAPNELVKRRFLPSMTISNAVVEASSGGTPGRPGPAVPEIENLYVVGDWVGGVGMLADTALCSAETAVRIIAGQRTVLTA